MDYDVVVAGAGPVGLLLAAELRLGGARVLVLERESDPAQPRKAGSMGARALNGPTVAALHLRGLVPAIRENAFFWYDPAETPEPGPEGVEAGEVFAGHFAGIGIRADRLDFADPEFTGEPLSAGVVAQQDLETVLGRHARELGAEIRRGVAVSGFVAGEDRVRVRAGDDEIEAGWLVGCDGGRSTVRKLAGFDFPGVDPIFTGRQAIVDMEGGEELTAPDWRPGVNGSYVVGGWAEDGKSRVHTVEFTPPPADRDSEVTAAEIQESLRRVSGTGVTVTAVHAATRYADTTRQAETYRRGRVLLAGDAAHVHSPAGGQGLNLGLGDAMNLGWKLAAVARGFAPMSLVDTYTAEQWPIGAWVQRWSMAQTAAGVPGDPRVAALRDVLADLLDTPHGATYVVKKIGGGWQRYDLPGDHPLIGRRAPDFVLADGTTFAQHAATGAGLVLDPRGETGEVAEAWGDRVTVVTAAPTQFPGTPPAFVRPDGYIAWVSGGRETLAESLRCWLGAPASSR
ncbi:FAD-dependent monooxygenase [Amycolatopsis sp. NPDC059027]|uniref:FAD-dependent monooxygenase n=1 Tax=Amycolatopsis sp. NPDC059027 TaxID=3346709 RepID=UPI003672C1D4